MRPTVHYVLTKAHYLSPSWDRWIPSMLSVPLWSIFHLHQVYQVVSFLHTFWPEPLFIFIKKSCNALIIVGTWFLFPRHLLRAIAASSGAPCQAVAVPFDCQRQSRRSLAMSCIIFHLPNLHCSHPMQLTVEMDTSFAGMFSDISFFLKCVYHYWWCSK